MTNTAQTINNKKSEISERNRFMNHMQQQQSEIIECPQQPEREEQNRILTRQRNTVKNSHEDNEGLHFIISNIRWIHVAEILHRYYICDI